MTTRFKQRQVFIISISLVAVTLATYEPIRHNGFISYDDQGYITSNPLITAGISWQSLGQAFTKPHFFMWHPLTTISHMLDCQIFGLNPAGHHFISVLFHILNALLIFWILTATTGAMWPSAFVASVFALHPLQIESVAWAAERKTVLSGIFWFLTIAVYIWYTKRPGIGRYILLFMVYALCIMTKPVVVTLPFVLLLLDYWPLERIGKVSAGRLITEKIPLLILSVVLSVITFIVQHQGGVVVSLGKISLKGRIGNTFTSYISYISKMIWPTELAVIYPYRSTNLSDASTVGCIILFVLMLFLSIYIGRRRKYVAMGWLWYIGTLVPVIGLVQSGSQAMANHYMYIPILGLLIIIAWGTKDLVNNKRKLQIAAAISAGVVLTSTLILSRTQVRYWQDSLTLFEHTLKITENNPIAENNYGCALYDSGRVNETILHLSRAVKMDPLYIDARNNLGKVFLKEGKLNEAIACFNEVIKQYENLAEAHYDLGVASDRQKRSDEAIKHLNEVLQTGKNKAEIYTNLGTAYTQLGKYDLAIENWTKAAELKPDDAELLNNLAWLLATTGDVSVQNAKKAVELAQHACELTGYKNPSFLDTLAAAYAAAGRFDDAVKTAQQALDIAKSGSQKDLNNEIQSHVKLYQAGQPYRQK